MFLPPNETTPLITVNGSLKLCLIVKAGFRRRTLSPRPSNSAALSVGRVADAVIAGLSLAVTLPLMIIVAIAIRLDSPGPVFECEDSSAVAGAGSERCNSGSSCTRPASPLRDRTSPGLAPFFAMHGWIACRNSSTCSVAT